MAGKKRSSKKKAEKKAASGRGRESHLFAARTDGAPKVEEKYPAPAVTYRKSVNKIASSLAEQARAGSYLHARALQEIVREEEARKKSGRRAHNRLLRELIEKLDVQWSVPGRRESENL